MTAPCGSCGQRRLVAVLIPGHEDVEAVICLVCGAAQRDVAIARTPHEPEDERRADPRDERPER